MTRLFKKYNVKVEGGQLNKRKQKTTYWDLKKVKYIKKEIKVMGEQKKPKKTEDWGIERGKRQQNKRQTHKRVNSKLINTKYDNSYKIQLWIKIMERGRENGWLGLYRADILCVCLRQNVTGLI